MDGDLFIEETRERGIFAMAEPKTETKREKNYERAREEGQLDESLGINKYEN